MPKEIVLAGQSDSQVLVPTHVYGNDAEQIAAKWGAKWSTGSFAEFRKTMQRDRPLVVAFTPGEYSGQDWYLGERIDQDIYLIGIEGRPVLRGDALTASRFASMYIKGLDLANCGISAQSFRNGPTNMYLTDSYLHDTIGDQNTIGTPNEAGNYEFNFYVWNTTFEQCGSRGNTRHMMYIHGRPYGLLWVDNVTVLGTKGCSAFKSTCVRNEIRNSYISTVQDRNDLSRGLKASILIDVPADSDSIVDRNTILLFRDQPDAIAGELGLDNGAIAWRPRREFHASDRPVYRSTEWNDRTFWTDRAKPFLKEVTNNHFVLLPGSRKTPPVDAQGTHPRRAVREFGDTIIESLYGIYDVWFERDWTLDQGNTYEGFPLGYEAWDLIGSESVAAVESGSKWDQVTRKRTVPSVVVKERP